MCAVYAINIAARYVVTTVFEPIRLELKLTDAGAAFLTGIPLALFYVVFGLPIAWLADRSNRRNIVAGSLVVWSGFTVLCGLSQSYWQFLTSRIGVGVGEAGATPPSTSIVSDCFPAERRLMALSIFALGAPIGAWLGADTAGAVAQAYGWRAAFFALGVPGVLVGALVFLTIREPRRGRLDAVAAVGKASFSESLAFLWRQRAAFHVIMGGGVWSPWGVGLLWLARAMLWAYVPAIYFFIGPCMALVLNLAPSHMRSTFTAWSVLVGNVFNLIVAVQGVGILSDWFGGAHGADAASLRWALLLLAPTGFWATWHFFLGARTVVPEMKRAVGYGCAANS